jgi:endonuclease YncB( thermonuclease family)
VLRRKSIIAAYTVAFAALISTVAEAKDSKKDQAPPPPAVPVGEVDQTPLVPPGPQSLEGPARAVTGDRIALGDYRVRLYGIASPDISAEHGPQARLALDGLVKDQRVKCAIIGKTPDGDQLGRCSAGDSDLAEKMLGQGLAAVYRAGDPNDETQQALAAKYDTAESNARQSNLGIWEKTAPAAARPDPEPILSRAGLAYILALIAVLTIPITMVSIWRGNASRRERARQTRRYALATGLAAEAEIVRAGARQIQAQIAAFPKERPVPIAVTPMLALPSAAFWTANAERLELLPVEVMVPLLRLHALHEEAVRKVALAPTIPQGAVAGALAALETAADRAIDTVERAMGIKREKPAEPPVIAPEPAAPAEAAAPAPAPSPAAPKADQIADSAPLPR